MVKHRNYIKRKYEPNSALDEDFIIAYKEKAEKSIAKSLRIRNLLSESNSDLFFMNTEDFLLNTKDYDQWSCLKQEFLMEYIHLTLKDIYFKFFPNESSLSFENILKKTKETGKWDSITYFDEQKRFNYAFMVWIEENGFIHSFKDHLYIIYFDGTDFSAFMSGDIPVRKFNLDEIVIIFNGLMDNIISLENKIVTTKKRKERLEIILAVGVFIIIILIARLIKG